MAKVKFAEWVGGCASYLVQVLAVLIHLNDVLSFIVLGWNNSQKKLELENSNETEVCFDLFSHQRA